MSAPRIIAGRFRGRRLETPDNRDIRPTSERMREALFNILGPETRDATVLDLFAGTGAVGLEALSRGARSVIFVEHAAAACRIIEANIAKLGVGEACRVLRRDALWLPPARATIKLVFADPPYREDLLAPALIRLVSSGWVDRESTIIAELEAARPMPEVTGLEVVDERRYGAGRLVFLRLCRTTCSARL